MSNELVNEILNDKRRRIPSYSKFIDKGIYLGEGAFKRAYRLGNYVMCTPVNEEDKWSTQQFNSQVNYWENNKHNSQLRKYLNPILKHGNELEPYYITLYCEPINDSIYLTNADFNSIMKHSDLYSEDIIKEENQGILFGKLVLIDYGMTHNDFLNWQLDINGVDLRFEEDIIYGDVGLNWTPIELNYELRNKTIKITSIQMHNDWNVTPLIEMTLTALAKDFIVECNIN